MVEHALDKLQRKNLDLIVANDVSKTRHRLRLRQQRGDHHRLVRAARKHVPKLSKDEIAHIILDEALKVLKKKRKVEEDWY